MDERTSAGRSNPVKSLRSRCCRIAGIISILAFVLLMGLPWIVANTPLRSMLVNRALGERELQATVGEASFGWFSPVGMQRVAVARADRTLAIDIARLEVERPLLSLLFSLPAIGMVAIDEPRTVVVVGNSETPELPTDTKTGSGGAHGESRKATLAAVVRNGSLTLYSHDAGEPVIDVQGLSVTALIENGESGRVLRIEPVLLFDRKQLTPQLCDRGLQLVAPILADAAAVSGNVSIDLARFRVPLDEPDDSQRANTLEIAGSLRLHEVHTGLKNPMLVELAEAIGRILGTAPPETVRILDNTEVRFEMRQGRVYHEGLAFVLPEVSDELVIRTSGTVGLDESLDLEVNVSLPAKLARGIPVLGRLTERPLVFQMAGTINRPQLRFPEGRDLLGELSHRLGGGVAPPAGEQSVEGAVGNLIGNLADRKKGTPVDVEATTNNVLDLIQAVRKQKQERQQQQQQQPKPQNE